MRVTIEHRDRSRTEHKAVTEIEVRYDPTFPGNRSAADACLALTLRKSAEGMNQWSSERHTINVVNVFSFSVMAEQADL